MTPAKPACPRCGRTVDADNQSFNFQASTDLAAWNHLTTLTNETGILEFHDPDNSHHDCRYYRVLSR